MVGDLIPNRVFVGGIPANADENELHKYFSELIGTDHIMEVKIICDNRGLSKGYGFVTFDSEQEATKMLSIKAESLIFKDAKLNISNAYRRMTNRPYNNKNYMINEIQNDNSAERYYLSPANNVIIDSTTTTITTGIVTPPTSNNTTINTNQQQSATVINKEDDSQTSASNQTNADLENPNQSEDKTVASKTVDSSLAYSSPSSTSTSTSNLVNNNKEGSHPSVIMTTAPNDESANVKDQESKPRNIRQYYVNNNMRSKQSFRNNSSNRSNYYYNSNQNQSGKHSYAQYHQSQQQLNNNNNINNQRNINSPNQNYYYYNSAQSPTQNNYNINSPNRPGNNYSKNSVMSPASGYNYNSNKQRSNKNYQNNTDNNNNTLTRSNNSSSNISTINTNSLVGSAIGSLYPSKVSTPSNIGTTAQNKQTNDYHTHHQLTNAASQVASYINHAASLNSSVIAINTNPHQIHPAYQPLMSPHSNPLTQQAQPTLQVYSPVDYYNKEQQYYAALATQQYHQNYHHYYNYQQQQQQQQQPINNNNPAHPIYVDPTSTTTTNNNNNNLTTNTTSPNNQNNNRQSSSTTETNGVIAVEQTKNETCTPPVNVEQLDEMVKNKLTIETQDSVNNNKDTATTSLNNYPQTGYVYTHQQPYYYYQHNPNYYHHQYPLNQNQIVTQPIAIQQQQQHLQILSPNPNQIHSVAMSPVPGANQNIYITHRPYHLQYTSIQQPQSQPQPQQQQQQQLHITTHQSGAPYPIHTTQIQNHNMSSPASIIQLAQPYYQTQLQQGSVSAQQPPDLITSSTNNPTTMSPLQGNKTNTHYPHHQQYSKPIYVQPQLPQHRLLATAFNNQQDKRAGVNHRNHGILSSNNY